ncbi:MAG: alpha/beta hydrolase [Actinomycetota bacterium]|nr:alpha/beta hydrolase [Actinomycetota bacterium]
MNDTLLDIGGPVRITDYGGDGSLLLLIHGLGGSTENWDVTGPDLSDSGHAVAIDLVGFGESVPGDRRPSVEDNARLVAEVIQLLGYENATLIGNSMGGLISLVAAAEHAHRVERIVLVNPALPVSRRHPPDFEVLTKLLGPLVPGIGVPAFKAYRATHSPEEETTETLKMTTADPSTVSDWAKERLTEANRRRRGQDWVIPAFLEADRSIARYVLRPRRYRKLIHRVGAPTLLIHGTEDRLVAVDSARWAAAERPCWEYAEMDGVGHVPMLEAADRFVSIVSEWLAE